MHSHTATQSLNFENVNETEVPVGAVPIDMVHQRAQLAPSLAPVEIVQIEKGSKTSKNSNAPDNNRVNGKDNYYKINFYGIPKPNHQKTSATTSKAKESFGGNSNNTTVIRPIVMDDNRDNDTFTTLMNNVVGSNPAREKIH